MMYLVNKKELSSILFSYPLSSQRDGKAYAETIVDVFVEIIVPDVFGAGRGGGIFHLRVKFFESLRSSCRARASEG
jgi:hypothetical protein